MAFPRTRVRSRPHGRAGFTLVETLVALTVLGAVSPALYRVAVMLRGGTMAADDRTRSEIVARTLLDAALTRRRLEIGTASGLTDGRRWSIATDRIDLDWPRLAAPERGGRTSPQAILGGAKTAAPMPSRTVEADPARQGTWQETRQETRQEAPWIPVRLRIRVETGTRPLEVETVTLARASSP